MLENFKQNELKELINYVSKDLDSSIKYKCEKNRIIEKERVAFCLEDSYLYLLLKKPEIFIVKRYNRGGLYTPKVGKEEKLLNLFNNKGKEFKKRGKLTMVLPVLDYSYLKKINSKKLLGIINCNDTLNNRFREFLESYRQGIKKYNEVNASQWDCSTAPF